MRRVGTTRPTSGTSRSAEMRRVRSTRPTIGTSRSAEIRCALLLESLPIRSTVLPFALVSFTAKERGRSLCRVSGEAVGCPIRTTEERCAQWAHSTLRNGTYWLKLLHFTRAKTMRRTQCLELSGAHYSKYPTACGRQFAKMYAGEFKPPHFLPWKGSA